MIIARATIEDGGLSLKHRRAFEERVQKLPDGGYRMILEEEREYRSNRLNRFYWGVVVEGFCRKFEGHTKDEMHEVLRYKFNRRTVTDPATGEVLELGMPTHSMPQAEFQIYVDACQRYGDEQGVVFDMNWEEEV